MRPRTLLILPAAMLLAAGCGDDSDSADTTVPGTEPATAAPTAPAATTVPRTTPASTVPPATTPPPATTAATTAPAVVEIVVDADSAAAPTEETVALGQQVRLVIRTATAQEFHMHGYDLEDSGTEVVFAFTADIPGAFELESHDTGDLLLTLTVA